MSTVSESDGHGTNGGMTTRGVPLMTRDPRAARWLRMSVSAVALVLVGFGAQTVRAQCSTGTFIGSCSGTIGYEGCCNGQSVTWCEGAAMCEINCATNINNPTNTCCTTSSSAGCCDAAVMACVCELDDFCCGAPDPFFGDPGVWDEFCVDIAILDCGGCGTCSGPATQCGWQAGEGYYDCSPTATADPSGAFPRQCGAACTPQCGTRQCGPDGCGGVCGQCTSNQSCNATGQCVASCTPQCTGRQCGPDGCGGVCGQCLSGQSCNATTGQCAASCTPQCSGRECGADGCGGVCGQCLVTQECSAAGQCGTPCQRDCNGKTCGEDGCGGTCGDCPLGRSCQAGACIAVCVPSCEGRVCGDDGCSGSCGTCPAGESCDGGACVSSCSCDGKQCGDDGCGRVCGFCGPNTVCNAETQQCDAAPVTVPDQDPTIPGPENCPPGQMWNQFAGACVLDPNQAANGRGDSSGCGGAPGGVGGGGGVAAVLAGLVAVLMRRRVALKAR